MSNTSPIPEPTVLLDGLGLKEGLEALDRDHDA